MGRRYRYVGPDDVRRAAGGGTGADIRGVADLGRWLADAEVGEPATFVVTVDGVLRLAPRRSEHVACAEGADVLAAGEMGFDGAVVSAVSNQSTGYCPDPDSWPAVAAALDRAGIPHPGGFTDPITFRRCEHCGERNIVRDGDFTCAVCGGALPGQWNFAGASGLGRPR